MHVHAEVNGLSGFKRKRQKGYIKLERERSRDREGIWWGKDGDGYVQNLLYTWKYQ